MATKNNYLLVEGKLKEIRSLTATKQKEKIIHTSRVKIGKIHGDKNCNMTGDNN